MSGSWFSKNHGSKTVWILLPLNRKLKASCLSFLMRPESLHGKQTLRGNAHSSILFDFFFGGGGDLKFTCAVMRLRALIWYTMLIYVKFMSKLKIH